MFIGLHFYNLHTAFRKGPYLVNRVEKNIFIKIDKIHYIQSGRVQKAIEKSDSQLLYSVRFNSLKVVICNGHKS